MPPTCELGQRCQRRCTAAGACILSAACTQRAHRTLGHRCSLTPEVQRRCRSNYIHPWGWRLPLALAGAPGFIILIAGIVLPDSPVSLIERGHLEKVCCLH